MSEYQPDSPGELHTWPGDIPCTSKYTIGPTAERFLTAVIAEGKVYASPCPECNINYLPARLFCERCLSHTDNDWVEVPKEGTLQTFTVLREDMDGEPIEPKALGFATFEGCEGGLLLWMDAAPDSCKTGMPVKWQVSDEPMAQITDLSLAPV